MKKKHLLLTLALAGVVALSAGAFAGCGNNDNTDDSGKNPPITGDEGNQGTTPVDHGTVTSSSVAKAATVTGWTTGTYSDVKVLYLNENVMVNYTKYTLFLNDSGYALKQQKANVTVLDEDSTETGENILVIGTDLPSATIPGAGGSVGGGPGGPGGAGGPSAQAETGGAQTTDAADGRKVKVEFSDAADAVDGQGNLLNVSYSGSYWVQNGDYVLLSALSVDTEGAKVTSNTFIKAQTAGMVVELATGGKFEIVNDFDVSYTTAEADKNDFMGWSTTYTLSYVENVGYLFAQVRGTYPKDGEEVIWSSEPTSTEVTVYIGTTYTAYSDGTITLGSCSCKFDGEAPRGGWYNDGFEVKVDSEASTFEITSEDAGGNGDISGGPQQGGTQGGPQS